jgi:hypothetical protein
MTGGRRGIGGAARDPEWSPVTARRASARGRLNFVEYLPDFVTRTHAAQDFFQPF